MRALYPYGGKYRAKCIHTLSFFPLRHKTCSETYCTVRTLRTVPYFTMGRRIITPRFLDEPIPDLHARWNRARQSPFMVRIRLRILRSLARAHVRERSRYGEGYSLHHISLRQHRLHLLASDLTRFPTPYQAYVLYARASRDALRHALDAGELDPPPPLHGGELRASVGSHAITSIATPHTPTHTSGAGSQLEAPRGIESGQGYDPLESDRQMRADLKRILER